MRLRTGSRDRTNARVLVALPGAVEVLLGELDDLRLVDGAELHEPAPGDDRDAHIHVSVREDLDPRLALACVPPERHLRVEIPELLHDLRTALRAVVEDRDRAVLDAVDPGAVR